ncbi:MAG: hypothetical protein CMJ83_11235 [Planctomycetes bacterium]|nr:hypothetical protein [Planctomycetota bacterium]
MITRNISIVTLCVLAFALIGGPVFAAPPEAADQPDKLLGGGIVDILEKGGPVMILILVGSIIALALAFERAVSLRRRTLLPRDLVGALKEAGGDVDRLEQAVQDRKGPLARIVSAGLRRKSLGADAIEAGMEAQGGHEVERLKRPVRPIAILATIQPLLGLLGTILGMIGTFNVLAGTAAAERVEKLAPGIGQALYTTAAGLCAAIPCVLLFHWLNGRVNRAAEEWSNVGTDVILACRAKEAS